MQEEEKQNRIGLGMIFVLIVISGFVDLINLIPIVGGLVSTGYWIVLSYYLWKTGHGLFNWKVAVPEIISVVVEWVPMVSFLPSVMAGTLAIVAISRIQDKTGINLIPSQTFKKMTPPRNQRVPVNSTAGIRPPRLPR